MTVGREEGSPTPVKADNQALQDPVEGDGPDVGDQEETPMEQGREEAVQGGPEGDVESGVEREGRVEESHAEDDVLGDVLGDPVKTGDLQSVSDVAMVSLDDVQGGSVEPVAESGSMEEAVLGGNAEGDTQQLPVESDLQGAAEEVTQDAVTLAIEGVSEPWSGTADDESMDMNPPAGVEDLVQVLKLSESFMK